MTTCIECDREPATPGSDLGLWCGTQDQIRYGLIPADLALGFMLRADNHAESHGVIDPDDRFTCRTHQAWGASCADQH